MSFPLGTWVETEMTFTEYEELVSGLIVLFQEYVDPKIDEISVANIISCIGTNLILKYLDDLHIGYGNHNVVVEYPDEDEQYAKEKINLLYKTLVRKNGELDKSSNIRS